MVPGERHRGPGQLHHEDRCLGGRCRRFQTKFHPRFGERAVKFAYADPPYLGCGQLYAEHHPDARIWDAPATHRLLIERLMEVNPDGWALSLNVPSLKTILSYCPE